MRVNVFIGLFGVVITVMLICAGTSCSAQKAAWSAESKMADVSSKLKETVSGVRGELDLHAGVQGERIENIDKATARNEAALLRNEEALDRIEALLRGR